MSTTVIIIIAITALLFLSRKAKAKREADIRNWSVDFRNDPAIRPITKKLPWKEL